MLVSMRRRAMLIATAGSLVAVGSAAAAGPALAYHINYATNGSGGAVPLGTSYLMTAANPFEFTNSSGGVVFRCTSSTLTGATTGGGAISSGLSVQASTSSGTSALSGCVLAGVNAPVTFTENFSTPWQLTFTGGGPSPSSPFTGTLTNINLTLQCGSNSETFTGTLSSGLSWTNAANGSSLALSNAQFIGETAHSGSGCGLSGPYGVTATYRLTKVGGKPVSATNNLWLLQN